MILWASINEDLTPIAYTRNGALRLHRLIQPI